LQMKNASAYLIAGLVTKTWFPQEPPNSVSLCVPLLAQGHHNCKAL
jgi:hypothetical protein